MLTVAGEMNARKAHEVRAQALLAGSGPYNTLDKQKAIRHDLYMAPGRRRAMTTDQQTTPMAKRRDRGVIHKCIGLEPVLATELAVAAARDHRSQTSIIEELLERWLDERKRGGDPAQQRLEVGA